MTRSIPMHRYDEDVTRLVEPRRLQPLLAACTPSRGDDDVEIPIDVTTLVIDVRALLPGAPARHAQRAMLRSMLDMPPRRSSTWLLPFLVGLVISATTVSLGLWLI